MLFQASVYNTHRCTSIWVKSFKNGVFSYHVTKERKETTSFHTVYELTTRKTKSLDRFRVQYES
jgi:hypothetical protein